MEQSTRTRPTRAEALAALTRNENAHTAWTRLMQDGMSGPTPAGAIEAAFYECRDAYRELYDLLDALTA